MAQDESLGTSQEQDAASGDGQAAEERPPPQAVCPACQCAGRGHREEARVHLEVCGRGRCGNIGDCGGGSVSDGDFGAVRMTLMKWKW